MVQFQQSLPDTPNAVGGALPETGRAMAPKFGVEFLGWSRWLDVFFSRSILLYDQHTKLESFEGTALSKERS